MPICMKLLHVESYQRTATPTHRHGTSTVVLLECLLKSRSIKTKKFANRLHLGSVATHAPATKLGLCDLCIYMAWSTSLRAFTALAGGIAEIRRCRPHPHRDIRPANCTEDLSARSLSLLFNLWGGRERAVPACR